MRIRVAAQSGAVAEDRTRETCLEGRSFTTKLRPRKPAKYQCRRESASREESQRPGVGVHLRSRGIEHAVGQTREGATICRGSPSLTWTNSSRNPDSSLFQTYIPNPIPCSPTPCSRKLGEWIPMSAQPDPTYDSMRIAEPQTWLLTTSFEF